MKNKLTPPVAAPSEDDIRSYARHLYVQNGCIPGHDLDNWLEAKACLEANIPRERSHARLHHHRNPETLEAFSVVLIEAIAPDGVVSLPAPPHAVQAEPTAGGTRRPSRRVHAAARGRTALPAHRP